MKENNLIRENERIDDLQIKGLKIIQNPKKFCFGMDAVLLANFSGQDNKINSRVLDLGTGTGIIPILLYGKTKVKEVIGLEIQGDMVEMAKRSILLNKLEDTIKIIEGDIKSPPKEIPPNYFDIIVTNPPYIVNKGGLVNPKESKAISRHEILCDFEDIMVTAKRYLKSKGKLFIIHRSDRLVDIISLMRKYNIEAKTIRFIHPSYNKPSNLVLIQGLKEGNPSIKVEEPLYVYQENGDYTPEIYENYQWEGENNLVK